MRRRLALIVFVLIAVTSIDAGLVQRAFTSPVDPYARTPYEVFLRGVRQRTAPGDVVVLVLPAGRPENIQRHDVTRASYVLSGRRVVPADPRRAVIDPSWYVAAWKAGPVDVNRPIIWERGPGVLFGRR